MPSLWDWNHPTVWLFTSKTASSSWLSSYQDESWDWHAYLLLFTGKAALLQNNFVRKYSRANKIPSFLTTVLVKLVVSKFWTKKEKKKRLFPRPGFQGFCSSLELFQWSHKTSGLFTWVFFLWSTLSSLHPLDLWPPPWSWIQKAGGWSCTLWSSPAKCALYQGLWEVQTNIAKKSHYIYNYLVI